MNWGKDDGPFYFKHHSYTCRTVRYQWGNYNEYKKRLKQKWGHLDNIKQFPHEVFFENDKISSLGLKKKFLFLFF